MSNQQTATNINTLAKATDVTPTDITCLLQSVANSIIADGAAEVLLDADDHAVKKFETFETKLLTDPRARSEFGLVVLGLLK